MSLAVVQVGHCGNQLGHNFFSILAEVTSKKKNAKNHEFLDASESRFFTYNEKEDKRKAHAIILDTKANFVRDVVKPAKNSFYYGADCYKTLKTGSEKNWAMGYNVNGPLFREFILDAVRKEVEGYDQFCGFLLFGSVAGGSGSGLGSYTSELLHDEFPSASLINISAWPFDKGDVAFQAYNAVLSVSAFQNFSDAIFVFENDWLMKLCYRKMGMENACMQDLNFVAGQQLANLLLPVDNYHAINPTLNDLLATLVPHPQFKLVGLRSVPQEPVSSLPFCTYNWPTLFRSLRRMLLYSTIVDEVYGKSNSPPPTTSIPISLTNLLLLRGRDCESADINYLHKPQLPYASWVPSSSRMNIWTNPNRFLSCDRTALLANNGQLSAGCVDKASDRAWNMFSFKAYFHYYEEYGLSEEDFYLSFLNVEQIISSYKSLKV